MPNPVIWHHLAHFAITRTRERHAPQEGKSNKEICRCLKRYIAREVYPLILKDLGTIEPRMG